MNLRAADINFALDTILQKAKETGSNAVYQHVDTEKIGLLGHSLDGEASAQVAGFCLHRRWTAQRLPLHPRRG